MGKKIIINGADFSANAVEPDYSWITVLAGAVTSKGTGDSMQTIALSENLPKGTVTRLTQQATGGSSGCIAFGARDSDNNQQHSNVWHDDIDTNSGEVIDIKTLSFNMKSLLIWFEKPGITATYKLEVSSV